MQIHTWMIKIVTLLCIISTVWAQQANCELVSDSANQVFIFEKETQLKQLSDYIRGYNLQFTPSDRLTPPFSRSDTEPLPAIPDGYSLIAIDILTNSNKAWAERGAILLNQQDSSKSLVLFGALNANYNLKFNKTVELTHESPTVCMDIVMVGIESAVVDCQQDNGTDVLYLVETKGVVKVPMGQGTKVAGVGRKSIGIATRDGVFVLAATLNDRVDKDSKDKNTISVYKVDLENKKIQALNPINAATLTKDTLSITDISSNSFGKIYLTDQKSGIIRFAYNLNKVSSVESSAFSNPRRVSSYVNPSGQELLFIATPTAIVQSTWTNSLTPVRYYELPSNVGQIRDLQANAYTIMLQNPDNYYFYRPGQTSIKDLLYTVANVGTIGIMDQQTPQAIVVGLQNSLAYVVRSGYFRLDGSEESQYTVEATSQSPSGNKTCSVTFTTKVIMDDTMGNIFTMKTPPVSQSAESPVNFDILLEDYYAGLFLKYKPAESPGVNYTLKFVEDFVVSGHVNLPGVSFMTTFPIDGQTYYRITKGGDTYSSQLCKFDRSTDLVDCAVTKTFRVGGVITTYDIFMGVVDGKSVPIMAYIVNTNDTTLQFQPLGNGQTPQPLSFTSSIAHVEANSLYFFLTVRDNPEILIYQASTYRLFYTISTSSFSPQQLNTIVRFKPRSVTLSPTNPNIIFIKNLQSVILMKFSQTGLSFISNIPILDSADNTFQWEVIVTGNRMIAVVKNGDPSADDRISEYAVEDVYKPIFLKEINVMNFMISNPLEIYYAFGSQMLFVRVQIESFIVFKLNSPAIESNYYIMGGIPTKNVFCVAEIQNNIIVQTINQTIVITKRIYLHPELKVAVATPQYSFKKAFDYGFDIWNSEDHTLFNGKIIVFNYQTHIEDRNISNDAISLPQTADKQWVELNANQLFNGSITSYKLECSYCQSGKISLIDHVNSIAKTPVLPSPPLTVLNLKPLSLLLSVTSKSLHTFQYNGTLANQTVLLSTCLNTVEYVNSTVILICTNETDQFFLVIDVVTMKQQDPIVVPDSFRVWNPLKMSFTLLKNQLLVLDNTLRGDGNGIVRVFSVAYTETTGFDIQPAATIDYVNFGCKSKTLISSIAILNTTKTNNSTLVVLALMDVGFGYIVHTPAGWQQGKLVDLSSDKKILDYVLENNRFLQLVALSGDKNTDLVVKNTVIMTMSSGAHLEMYLVFNRSDNTFIYNNFEIINTFNKYGKQTVLNSASFHPSLSASIILGWLSIGYYNESTSTLTNALYEVPVQLSTSPTNFKTSQLRSSPVPPSIPLAFYTNGAETRLVSPTINQTSLEIFNVSSKTYLLLNYDSPDNNCESIKVIAKNDYSTAQHNVAVKFVQPDDGGSGLGWYIWLLAGLGGIFVIGMIYGVIRFTRRKIRERKKISLLTEDEERV